jgi:hypothetical protein
MHNLVVLLKCLLKKFKRKPVKVRAIEFSLLQRCAAHLASKVDVKEAFNAGQKAVRAAAVKGTSDKMVGFKRVSSILIKSSMYSTFKTCCKHRTKSTT